MTEAVVDRLEVVEVEEEDGGRLLGAAALEDGPYLLGEEQEVGKPRQRVVERLVAELLLDGRKSRRIWIIGHLLNGHCPPAVGCPPLAHDTLPRVALFPSS